MKKILISIAMSLFLVFIYNKGLWLLYHATTKGAYSISSDLNDSVQVIVKVNNNLPHSIEHVDVRNGNLCKTNVYYHNNGIVKKIITTQNDSVYKICLYRADGIMASSTMFKIDDFDCKSQYFESCLIPHGEEVTYDSLGYIKLVNLWELGVLTNTFHNDKQK